MKQLPDVSSAFGAPMGRRSFTGAIREPVKVQLKRLKWVDGDYDEGGAYWGYNPGDFIFWANFDHADENHDIFVRCRLFSQAKDRLREQLPDAEFKIDHGEVSDFLMGYLETALFTTDTDGGSGDYGYRSQEMLPKLPEWFIAEASDRCERFQRENAELLAKAGNDWQNGSDLWYSSGGHGVGYFDRGYPDEVADPLQEAARRMGEHYLLPEDIGQTSLA